MVGAHPAAHAVLGLQDDDPAPAALGTTGALQSGETCPDDDDVGVHVAPSRCVPVWLWPPPRATGVAHVQR